MMPAKGPRKMVYPSMKLKNPVALSMYDKGCTNVTYNEDLLGENLPWTQSPATNDRTYYLSAPDVDILFKVSNYLWKSIDANLGTQNCHVISCPERIGADVGTNSRQCKYKGGEKGCGPIVPTIN
jgi:hypothetical protein